MHLRFTHRPTFEIARLTTIRHVWYHYYVAGVYIDTGRPTFSFLPWPLGNRANVAVNEKSAVNALNQRCRAGGAERLGKSAYTSVSVSSYIIFGRLTPETASIKRRGVRRSRACDQCRRHKIKCGPGMPCTQCSQRSKNCSYERRVLLASTRLMCLLTCSSGEVLSTVLPSDTLVHPQAASGSLCPSTGVELEFETQPNKAAAVQSRPTFGGPPVGATWTQVQSAMQTPQHITENINPQRVNCATPQGSNGTWEKPWISSRNDGLGNPEQLHSEESDLDGSINLDCSHKM